MRRAIPELRCVLASVLLTCLAAPSLAEESKALHKNSLTEYEESEALQNMARDKFASELPRLRPVRLYYLDPGRSKREPEGQSKRLHGYIIAAETALDDAKATEALRDSMDTIIKRRWEGVMACFEPHHAITLSDGVVTYDVIICFGCNAYLLYTPDGRFLLKHSFNARDEEARWDAAFNAAGLKR